MRAAVLGFFGRIWSRLLHLYFRLTRGLTLGVRAVVFSSDGKVLLVRHTYTPGWHFPGGGVEVNETVEGALAKELQQETGLLLVGKPRLQGVYLNSAVGSRDHILTYLCEAEGRLPILIPNPEIADLRYFGLDELPKDIEKGTALRLREITNGLEPCKNW